MTARAMTPRSPRPRRLLGALVLAPALLLAPFGSPAAAQSDQPETTPTPTVPAAYSPATYPGDPGYSTVPKPAGVTASMDVDVTSSDVSQVPRSVEPGDTFTVGIHTEPGAHCAGTISFRGLPPMELPDVAANGGICAWSVTAPLVAREGTAVVDTQVSRGGQSWRVATVVYVNPPAQSR